MAAKAVAFARQNQFRIIHVGLAFSEGHPEIPDVESLWLRLPCHLSVRQLTVRSFRRILFHMVNYRRLDRTCTAPVDPARRAILTQLKRRDGASISELAKP